jgi:hypothetical protein
LDTLTKSRDHENPRILKIHSKFILWEIEIELMRPPT